MHSECPLIAQGGRIKIATCITNRAALFVCRLSAICKMIRNITPLREAITAGNSHFSDGRLSHKFGNQFAAGFSAI